MTWVLWLYPRPWRDRYGAEFAEILAAQPASLGLFVDVVAGALDARLRPQVKPVTGTGEQSMTADLMKRCAAGGPQLTERDQWLAGAAMLTAAVVMSVIYIALRALFGHPPAIEAVGYTTFPGMMVFYSEWAYLKHRPPSTQVLVVVGALAALYLMFWAACAIAARL